MTAEGSTGAIRLGFVSAMVVAVLLVAYAAILALGLATLPAPDQPIGDPMIWMLEVLIIMLMPAIVALMAAIHVTAPPEARPFTLVASLFTGALAVLTCAIHFVILSVGRSALFAALPDAALFFSFRWPSVVYALDILAWDFFFPLAVLFAAPAFGGTRLGRTIRALLILSGVLALAGLIGVPTGDMRLRNIGIVGYVPVFLMAVVLLAVSFRRAARG